MDIQYTREEYEEICSRTNRKDLTTLHELCEKVSTDIEARCRQTQKKHDISEEDFVMRLGFFPAIRKVPGFDTVIGFEGTDAYYAKYEGEDQEKCLRWLGEFYEITDEDSFFEYIQNDRGCNLARMAGDVLAQINGRPNFDINALNEQGRYAFENTVHFMEPFAEYLPQAGVLAWDICEKIGLVRHAYRCGIIDRAEYCHGMMVFRDAAVENFSSWEEYMRSLIYGCGLYMYNFDMDESGIAGAIDFICMLTPMLLNSDLADSEWNP